jgi:hypothetical protein
LVPVSRPETLPLSFAQERLWFLDQLEPESCAYLACHALGINGPLDAQALEYSLLALIQRHETLRTTFAVQEGQPVQIIHPMAISNAVNGHVLSAGISVGFLPVIDLQGLLPEHRELQAQCIAKQEEQTPCNLAQGPLLRSALLRLGTQEHRVVLTLHHIITDGWSNEVFMYELTQFYQAQVTGQPVALAPLSIQYADYALWQRAWLQGEVLQAQLAYWRKQLADLPLLTLPSEHPRPAVKSSQGATKSVQIAQEVLQGLQRLCRQEYVTLFMALLAAFQVLLARYSGEIDIPVGTPVAGRHFAETEGLIGFFANTLVMRTSLAGNPTFVQILQRVREVCLGAYAHQDVPFEKVVEALEPERDLSRNPLFQVMFVLQNAPDQGNCHDGRTGRGCRCSASPSHHLPPEAGEHDQYV